MSSAEPPASSAADPVLEVRDLTVRLPRGMERPHAIEDVSFAIAAGEVLCIVGESGSGKSVTANTIMGLLPSAMTVERGSIRFAGRELLTLPEREHRALRGSRAAIIFQDPLSALNPLMTVGAQIEEAMAAHRWGSAAERQARVLALLEEVGLPDPALTRHQYPFRLSGGQRQRVMIAMALALEPELLIADEPTTALDVTTQAQILQLIASIQARKNMALMFITHDFGVVSEIADRVAVMEKGRLVEQGPAATVLTAPTHDYTRRLLAAVPKLKFSPDHAPPLADAPVRLAAQGLTKTYTLGSVFGRARTVRALEDVSFTLRRGRTLGVVGESGSGKSTLGRVVTRLIDADGGRLTLDGREVLALPQAEFRWLRPKIQMVFQDPYASLNPRRTVGSSLTIGPVAHGLAPAAARTRARETLARVGLDPRAYDRYPHEFSGGQRQRIGIARALMFDPEVLIADEAVSALDVSIQAQILELLDRVQRESDLAMLFITHDLRVASQICDDLMVMHRGLVVEEGPPARIFGAPREDYTRRLVAAIPGTS